MNVYFANILEAVKTLSKGLKLTFRHFTDARHSRTPIGVDDPAYFDQDRGIVTLQYPHESFPVPDNGRYRLHNEMEDCIVCDKCAKICPVDCIEIEPIRAVENFGTTSDGTPKRIHAAKFDIDMAKCCFCGLCTTVCPTECLTMTKAFDFSEFDVRDHNYAFGIMTDEEIHVKKKEWEDHQVAKAPPGTGGPEQKKPVLKPQMMRPKPAPDPSAESKTPDPGDSPSAPKPKFRPKPMVPRKPKKD